MLIVVCCCRESSKVNEMKHSKKESSEWSRSESPLHRDVVVSCCPLNYLTCRERLWSICCSAAYYVTIFRLIGTKLNFSFCEILWQHIWSDVTHLSAIYSFYVYFYAIYLSATVNDLLTLDILPAANEVERLKVDYRTYTWYMMRFMVRFAYRFGAKDTPHSFGTLC